MIGGFRTFTYEQRLEKWRLTKRDKIRRRGDVIEAYKLMTNKEVTPFLRLFLFANTMEADNEHTDTKSSRNRKVPSTKDFSVTVIKCWNGLGDETVSVGTLRDFKTRLVRWEIA